jgi:hypothetical protein
VADSGPSTTGLAFAEFGVDGMAQRVRRLGQIEEIASRIGDRELFRATQEILSGLLTDLNEVANRIAPYADEAIKGRIEDTKSPNRPQANLMEQHIQSVAPGLGFVKVAMIEELDKIINPIADATGRSWGTFWRAQEYGTGTDIEYGPLRGAIPSQADRVIYGIFEPSGDRPLAEQAGRHVGTDAAFIPQIRGYDDEGAGFGTIHEDLPGRHFLRDGTLAARAKYVEAMQALDAKWAGRIRELLRMAERSTARATGRTHTLIIDA